MASKIAFVILHYNAYEDTMECVSSIQRNLTISDFHIIVVDNNSPNGSGELLKEKYSTAENVTVLINESNMGFARGNNVGFSYAKHRLGAKYIVMLNNDTLLLHDDFFEKVDAEYKRSGFAVLGPVIKTPGNFCNINPRSYKERSVAYYRYLKVKYSIYILINYLRLGRLLEIVKVRLFGKKLVGDGSFHPTRETGVCLHGCFWIFGPPYIERFEGIDDRTFLYYEEELLYNRILKNGLTTVYTPDIEIFHKEDVSSNTLFTKGHKAEIFKHRQYLKSIKILISELKRKKADKQG